jgi:hypothetical protein
VVVMKLQPDAAGKFSTTLTELAEQAEEQLGHKISRSQCLIESVEKNCSKTADHRLATSPVSQSNVDLD